MIDYERDAAAAEALLSNRVFKDALAKVKDKARAAIEATDYDDTQGRERAYHRMKAVDELEAEIRDYLTSFEVSLRTNNAREHHV